MNNKIPALLYALFFFLGVVPAISKPMPIIARDVSCEGVPPAVLASADVGPLDIHGQSDEPDGSKSASLIGEAVATGQGAMGPSITVQL
jgi:hypothetical protein